MEGRFTTGRSAVGARRRRSFVLIAMAAVMVPAAIAWACNPQAHISLNNSTYGPGESITASGSYFNGNTCGCTVSTSGSSTSASGSAWTATLSAPSQAGSYTVVAQTSDGLTRTASYQVVDSSASGPTGSEQSSTGQTFKEPKVGGVKEPKVGGVSGGSGSVETGSGEQAFAGSVAAAPGGGSFFSGGGSGSASSATTQPSERAAVSDVWSGYAAGKSPSLTSGAAVPDGDTGSELSLGIVLLAVGLLALVAGLTTAEVMRRRAQVR